MPRYEIEPGRRQRGPAARISLIVILVLVLFGARSASSYAIEIAWWKELGQLSTWWSMLYYNLAPVAAATLLAFAVLWTAHARALRFAGTHVGEHRIYTRIAAAGLLLVGYFIAAASIDTWTVVRFAGSRGLPAAATAWHDAIFNRPLSFYLFDLPFYLLLRSYLLALVIVYSGLLGGRARLATALQASATERNPRARSHLFPAGRRTGIAFSARGRDGAAAGGGAALLSGPLRNGLQRARHVSGVNRLCGPEHRPAAAMAGNCRLPGRGCVRLDGTLVSGGHHGAGAGGEFGGAGRRLRAVRAPQRNLSAAALYPEPHSRDALRLRPGAAGAGDRVQGQARGAHRCGAP